MSSYNPNIPKPGDFQDNSQSQILSNFGSLDTTFEIDHTLFSDLTPHLGQHAQVTLFEGQGFPAAPTDPAPAFPASAIYSKNTGTTPNRLTNLFYATKPETGPLKYLQLTGLTPVSFTNNLPGSLGGGTGYVLTTPWGITVMWGQTVNPVPQPAVVFPTALSNSSYSLQITPIDQTVPLQEQSAQKSNNKFIAKVGTSSGSLPTIEWFVFGIT